MIDFSQVITVEHKAAQAAQAAHASWKADRAAAALFPLRSPAPLGSVAKKGAASLRPQVFAQETSGSFFEGLPAFAGNSAAGIGQGDL